MQDLELLELAAKAAGIEFGDKRSQPSIPALYLGPSGGWWNPLTDDGDALRLAVKLGLAVSVEYQVGSTVVLWGPPMGSVREPHDGDANAATRRAIVMAAAEVGKPPNARLSG